MSFSVEWLFEVKGSVTGLCGSIIELHSLLEKHFHQGGKKKII